MDTKMISHNISPQVGNSPKNSDSALAYRSKESTESREDGVAPLSIKEQSKLEQNRQILEATLEVSLSAGNRSMEVLYRAAIENINAELQPTMGEEAIQTAYDTGLDVSPEATADRIVSMSTAFFGSYSKQHPEMSQDEALESFVSVISGGIDKGFGEARDILDGLNVLEGDIAENIDKTYDLVQEGLKAFVDSFAE